MVSEVTRRDVLRLMEHGAQLVEVLPKKEYDNAHLPGAVNIPLEQVPAEASSRLDRARAVVVYCYDALCDMSPRAAWRLESLGFTEVHDYVASKVDWIGAGLPFEGARASGPTLARLADTGVPTCKPTDSVRDVRDRGDWDICVVVTDLRVVLGLVRAEAAGLEDDRPVTDVMQEAPRTYRPHVTATELEPKLDKAPAWLLVTNLDGTLVGVAWPDDVRKAARTEVADRA